MGLLDKKLAQHYSNASTQIDVPEDIAAKIIEIGRGMIPDEHLAGDGRVTKPHITIKYGVAEDEAALRNAVAGYHSFGIDLSKTEVFPPSEMSDNASVVVISVHGDELAALHKAVEAAMGTKPDDFPYTPHITVAYIQPKEAQHYAGRDDFEGMSFEATAVTLYRRDDENFVPVPLAKAAAFGDQHHYKDDIPTPLETVEQRPAVIDWYSDSPDIAGQEPELREMNPRDLLTDQQTVSESHIQKILKHIDKINKATDVHSDEHSPHPLILGTSEGDFIFDGNHRCAAALLAGVDIKVLYLDLRPVEDFVPEYYLGEEDEGKTAASPAAVAPELPEIAPEIPQEEEPDEEEVSRDEPATEQPKQKSPLLKKKQPKPKPKPKAKAPKKPTQNKNFKAWFGKSKVVGSNGKPLVVYHGTTHDFDVFDRSKAETESFYGKALYFTSSLTDLGTNYATDVGGDLTTRIERRSEQIMQEWEDQWDDVKEQLGSKSEEFPSWGTYERDNLNEQAKTEAKKEIAGGSKGASMPVYLSIQNPVYVQQRGGTEFTINTDEDGNESGNGVDLYYAMQRVAGGYSNADVQEVWNDLIGNSGGDFNAWDFEKQIRDGGHIFEDDNGNVASGNFIADVYQEVGFDGIIQDAYAEFGVGQYSRMKMDTDTKHYILWDPTKVKSAIGNVGTYDPSNPSITAAVNKRVIPIDDLPIATQADLTEEIAERLNSIGFEAPWGGEVYANDLRPELFGLVDPPTITVYDAPVESLYKTMNRHNSDAAVKEYEAMLRANPGMEFDPIFVNKGKFEDGGHRLEAYHRAGRKTIPVAEIGQFLDAPKETWERWLSGDEAAKFAAGRTGVGDLGLARNIMTELMPILGEQLPKPFLNVVNQPRANWLGEDIWSVGFANGTIWGETNTVIRLQRSIINNEETLRRILAHELAHHADNLVNGPKLIEKYQGSQVGYRLFMSELRRTGHGKGWQEYAQKFNAKYGADFVTEKSDETYAREELPIKPYWIAIWKHPSRGFYYAVSSRLSPKAVKFIWQRRANPRVDERITTTNDRMFIHGANIGNGWSVPEKDSDAKQKKLQELWDKAGTETPPELPNPWVLETKGGPIPDAKLISKYLEQDGKEVMVKPSDKKDFQGWVDVWSRWKTAAVPDVEKLERPVSKDYDRVAWVYNQMYKNRTPSLSWKDFQKQFPREQNSPLFTKIRQNRPQITLEDLDRWLEEYKEKSKEYQNYELEHAKYQDKATSYRDVEQLVLRVNQSASAAEIIGEDEMLKLFLDQAQQGSVQSGHPVGKNTVGWLRVDFINDEWILIDEVQSDLINAVELAKKFISFPTLQSLMDSYKSETVKQKIKDMGATEQMFQHSKGEFERRGYTPEKLEEMRQQLIGLFKDWAEYGIASLIEIARRHGIKNVAIHTSSTIAGRDPDLEADKAGMYYDQLAKSFGFKKEHIDVGNEEVSELGGAGHLKGEFWVRTASAKEADSHKITPLDETYYNDPAEGEETNAKAVVPERVRGIYDVPPLKTLAPQLFKESAASRLKQALMLCRPNIAQKAQAIYDSWDQNEEGEDVELGGGGICDEIAEAIMDVVSNVIFEIGGSVAEGGQPGDEHAWVIAYDANEVYGVDIPHTLYERGGGYSWKKVPGVTFTADDVEIFPLDIDPAEIAKEGSAPDVQYRVEVLDSHGGELFCRAEARINGKLVGAVDFNEYENEIWVKYVEVRPEYRRKGIATGMYEKIKEEFPDERIVSSGTTPEGTAFREKLTERGVLAFQSSLLKRAADPNFPPTFVEYAQRHGGVQKFIEGMGDAWSHYEEAFSMQDDWDELSEQEQKQRVEEYAIDDMERRYADRVNFFDSLSFPVDVYREISLKNPKDLKTKGIGVFWAWDEEHAEAHWGTGGDHVILHAVLTNPSQIDWEGTMLANLDPATGEEENEARLKDGTKLRLVGVEGLPEGGYGVSPPKTTRIPSLKLPMTVTAVYAEGQNQVQHTDHEAVGLTKTLKSNPFAEELEALHQDLGQEPPEVNPALDTAKGEGQPEAKGEQYLPRNRTGAALAPTHVEVSPGLYKPVEEEKEQALSPDEMDSLYERAKENIERSKAKPDTEKQPAQRPITETPQFKAWFKNSQVVDDNGKPMMAFHATVQDFSTFKTEPRREIMYAHSAMDTIGAWFTTSTKLLEAAHKYFMRRVGPGPRTMPVYLSIQKPLVVDERRDLEDALDKLVEKTDKARWGRWQAAKWQGKKLPAINYAKGWRKALEKSGYDGIMIENDFYGEAWVALHPNQIKSAIGNTGEFSPENPEITASKTAAKKYYHATDTELAPGTILKPGRAGWMSDYPEVNAFLEKNRPKGKLPRGESVFMTSSFDAATWWGRFVYEVQPIGKVEKNDYAWFEDLIVARDNGELEESQNIAGYYWNGEPHSNLWEYRAPEARVIEEVTKKTAAYRFFAKGFKGDPRDTIPGQVYLLHFDIEPGQRVKPERPDARKPFHARHYLGWAEDAHARIQQHYEGTGAKITQALHRKGITFTVARIWDDQDRNFERRLKNQGGLSRWCPICHRLGLVPESRYRAPAMDEVKVVPKEMRYGPDYVEDEKVIKKSSAMPERVVQKARQMLADLHGNEKLCGNSGVMDGYWIETHTLGCRNAADEPPEKWQESHERIRDEYYNDDTSLVINDEGSSNFVTITPQRNKKAAQTAIRRGKIEPGGAYFSLPGTSTYHDELAVEQGEAQSYDLDDVKIADTSKPEVAKAILSEALKDERLTDVDREQIQELLDESEPVITYIENDELPLPDAAKKLGYGGIRVWENDDIAEPSSVFVWDTAKIKTAASGSAEGAVAEIDAKFPANPLNPKERVVTVDGNPVAVVEVTTRSGKLRLKSIRALEPGKGAGSLALSEILEIADEHGVEVELTASPFGDEATRLDKDALTGWYRKHRFEDEPGKDPALGYMVRQPKTADTDILIENEGGNIYGDYASVDELPEISDGMFHDKGLEKKLKSKGYHTVAILHGMDVDEDKRGKGYGNDLLDRFLEETKGLPVILLADTAQTQAEGFDVAEWYKRHGFKEIGSQSVFPLMVRW